MATKVTMPQMGESIFEGTITKWLKKVGDTVDRDEPLYEISTDKVDSEIPSPASGTLAQILVPEGQTVQINTVLAIINGEGTATAPEAAAQMPAPPAQPAIEEEKPELPKPGPTFVPEPDMPVATKSAAAPPPKPVEALPGIRAQDIRTSPLVRRLARENNIDLAEVHGSGMEGRITKDDVLNYLSQRTPGVAQEPPQVRPQPAAEENAPRTAAEQTQEPPRAAIEVRFVGESEIVPMSPMRKAIAEHMVLSKKVSAHVNTVFEVDVTSIVRLRETHKAEFEKKEGIQLTFTPFFAKALVDNVREFPAFNSSVSGDNIVYKKAVNLGVAVALEAGLLVPVIKDAHLKSFTGLALTIFDLADRARTKRLKPEEVQNGTISMTNPGSYGSLFNTPIISQPQVAILGIGGIEKRPVVIQDAIAIRSMVCLSLTFDHRVIDGAVADQFMAKLKQRLQAWTDWVE